MAKPYTYSNESTTCVGDLHLPETPITADTPKMLLIHGGSWLRLDRHSVEGIAQHFAQHGLIVLNIDYRLSSEAPWPACGNDCLKAADLLIRGAFAPEIAVTAGKPIFICGVSAGGHLALMTGLRMAQNRVRGTISISGIADPEPDAALFPFRYERLFAGKPIEPNAFPMACLTRTSSPILLIHCLNDTIVPKESAYNFAKYASTIGADVRTYLYDRERHNQGHAIWIPGSKPRQLYPDITDAIHAFLRDCLGQPQPLPMANPAQYLGKLRHIPSQNIDGSAISIGFECLDRDLYQPELCYDRLQAAGVKHARVQTGWCKCETEKGVYTFDWLDSIVDNLLKRGIQPWFNVGFGNRLYMDNTYGETPVGFVPLYFGNACIQAWKNYCAALAEHFRGRITHFEIWNETNIDCFWRPMKSDPAEYATLIDISQAEIRKAIPNAAIGACISGYRNQYLDEFARQKDILAKINFFSVHSYSPLPDVEYADAIRYLRRLFDAYGGTHISIWQGEGGFAHWTPRVYWQPRAIRESYQAQANWLIRRYLIDLSLGLELSSIFIVVDMMQKDYQMANSTQSAFNVARQGILNGICYTPKPAYHALANVATLFQHNIRPIDGMVACSLARSFPLTANLPHLEDTAVWKQLFTRDDGQLLCAYYLPVSVQYDFQTIPDADFTLYDEPGFTPIQNPVLINLLTGDVRRLASERQPFSLVLKGLPLDSIPMVIADASILG